MEITTDFDTIPNGFGLLFLIFTELRFISLQNIMVVEHDSHFPLFRLGLVVFLHFWES